MRLAHCLLLEAMFALVLAAAVVWGGARAIVAGYDAFSGSRARKMAVVRPHGPSLRARQDLSGETGPDVTAEESPGTFLGMSDELLLERMGTEKVVRLKFNRGGSSLSFRVDFADGSRAAWKPAQTNAQTVPRKEVAAYRINRLLGLNAVPPAIPRAISRDELFSLLHPESAAFVPRIRAETIVGPGGRISGEASYWIPLIKDSPFDTPAGHTSLQGWLSQGQPVPFEHRGLLAQVSRMVVFDFLIANPDRYSGGNMKVSADGSRLFFMDNTMSFFLDPDGHEKNRQNLWKTQRFSRGLLQALADLDPGTLRRLMHEPDGTDLLTESEMRAVVARRVLVEKYVGDLVKQYGEKEVLYFP